jgi:ribosomal-protein-alanine N-acetyltransferase
VPELERLRSNHDAAVLAFEQANRDYFAGSIGDRGDDYFEHFAERHHAMLADQAAGTAAFYVLVDEGGAVIGRFNLYGLDEQEPEVGYRVAEHVTRKGMATAALLALCALARADHGLTVLRARTKASHVASQRVLEKAGFSAVGPCEVAGGPGVAYEITLREPPAGTTSA